MTSSGLVNAFRRLILMLLLAGSTMFWGANLFCSRSASTDHCEHQPRSEPKRSGCGHKGSRTGRQAGADPDAGAARSLVIFGGFSNSEIRSGKGTHTGHHDGRDVDGQ